MSELFSQSSVPGLFILHFNHVGITLMSNFDRKKKISENNKKILELLLPMFKLSKK